MRGLLWLKCLSLLKQKVNKTREVVIEVIIGWSCQLGYKVFFVLTGGHSRGSRIRNKLNIKRLMFYTRRIKDCGQQLISLNTSQFWWGNNNSNETLFAKKNNDFALTHLFFALLALCPKMYRKLENPKPAHFRTFGFLSDDIFCLTQKNTKFYARDFFTHHFLSSFYFSSNFWLRKGNSSFNLLRYWNILLFNW